VDDNITHIFTTLSDHTIRRRERPSTMVDRK
jgi:hypothetical protein